MPPQLTIQAIKQAARDVLKLLSEYKGGNVPSREMLIDPVLYALLLGRNEKIKRQHPISGKKKKPKRIDFRSGGTNPVMLEFAVRPPAGGGQLYGSQNASELRKLTKVSQTQARTRVLLLLDLCPEPLKVDNLRATYSQVNSGPGKFKRHSVRVIYVHREVDADFPWQP